VLLYELLTGQRPFTRVHRSVHELERAVLEEDPTMPSNVVRRDPRHRRLKGDLDAIVLTAMHKEPSRRYASAAELGADVRRHIAGEPVIARRASSADRLRRWTRRHRVVLGGVAVGGFAGAALIVAVAMRNQRNGPGDPALRSARIVNPQHVTNDDGLEINPAISPDGGSIAYAAGPEGAMRIFVRRRGESRAVVLTNALDGDHRRPRWSPDGTRLLSRASERSGSSRRPAVRPVSSSPRLPTRRLKERILQLGRPTGCNSRGWHPTPCSRGRCAVKTLARSRP
jgi:hypothetical protein